MSRVSSLLGVLILLGVASSAGAESFFGLRSGYHVVAGGGDIKDLFQGAASSGDFNGGSLGLFGVHYFTANLGAELNFDIYEPEVDFNLGSDPNQPIPANGSFGMFPLSASVRYRLYPERLSPFGVIGLSLNPYRFDISTPLLPQVGIDQSGVKLGYQLGVGAELPFGLRWTASAELLYRGMGFKTKFLANDGSLIEYKPNFGGVSLLFGLGYVF